MFPEVIPQACPAIPDSAVIAVATILVHADSVETVAPGTITATAATILISFPTIGTTDRTDTMARTATLRRILLRQSCSGSEKNARQSPCRRPKSLRSPAL